MAITKHQAVSGALGDSALASRCREARPSAPGKGHVVEASPPRRAVVRSLCVLLAALFFCLCEASPRIVVLVEVPSELPVGPEQVHLETASSAHSAFEPQYRPRKLEAIRRTPEGLELSFLPRLGNETFTYARVFIDLDRDGTPSPGDLTGELAPAPFRALDPGPWRCASNLNRAPNIVLHRVE